MISDSDNQSGKTESTYPIISFISRMVAHFVSVLFTAFIVYTAQPGSSLFSWHPTLMSIAFLCLLFEGILVFSPQSSLVSSLSRKAKLTAHWLFQVSALTFAVSGFLVIWYNKHLNNSNHFTTWHGLCGVVTVGYLFVQIMGGILGKYPQILNIFRIKVRLADLKIVHATSGLLAYLLVSITFMLAMFSTWFTSNITGTTWFGCFGCISCLALIVMNQVTTAYLPSGRPAK
ncbi:cytochrome b561 domain-containing protein 2-like [Gigantopelta aegis]|uniref:cytochrome b561 domain-containing protein 2-like n=1 Tax=Gigantopelta aegis TaxID=1735272 RepID=UPI001B887877|nr:cytochrome b561 domain-containing protein 2-like [Gigantopelta aegis]